jgi:hypothetical protein
MRISFPHLLVGMFFLSITVNSSAQEITPEFIEGFVDVLAHPALQKNDLDIEIVEQTSALEDQVQDLKNTTDCSKPTVEKKTCDKYQSELMPKHLKENGWQVLFEAKYKPLAEREDYSKLKSTGAHLFSLNVDRIEDYYEHNPVENLYFQNEAELRAEAQKIAGSYADALPEEFFGPLVLQQIQQTQNHDEMINRFKSLTQNMNDTEFTYLLTHLAGWVDYNDERAAFDQSEGAGLGVISPFDQIANGSAGICGDIHSMVAKFAEARNWEAFTVGYASAGTQHVVTAVVNPENPDKLLVINYGTYEEQSLNKGNAVLPAPTLAARPEFAEIGTQLRIFKNDAAPGEDGAMQQIGTIPTPLGSFMRGLFDRKDQVSRAMPENENYTYVKAGGKHKKSTSKLNDDGTLSEKKLGHGIIIYEGETDNAQIYGIAVSRDVYNNLYVYDPDLNKCVKKKSSYFSVGVAGSLVDLPTAELTQNYYVYLNMRGGKIFHIYQTQFFQFKGLLGYEAEAFVALESNGNFLTADGNFSTFAGVMADYQKNGTAFYAGAKIETNLGLRNQNLMTDFSTLPSNIQPFSFNAIRFDAGFKQKIGDNMNLVSDNNYVLSRVGSRIMLSTGVIKNNTSVMLHYQNGVKALPLGNSLQEVNLLQNMNYKDGIRLQVNQSFSLPRRGISGQVSGFAGLNQYTNYTTPMFGGTLKINFRPRKR